jgi:hypothetical protein
VAHEVEEADASGCFPQVFQETRTLRRMAVESTKVEGGRVSVATATGVGCSWMTAEITSAVDNDDMPPRFAALLVKFRALFLDF